MLIVVPLSACAKQDRRAAIGRHRPAVACAA